MIMLKKTPKIVNKNKLSKAHCHFIQFPWGKDQFQLALA